MPCGEPNIAENPVAADWIAPKLRGDSGAATLTIPRGEEVGHPRLE